MLQSLYRHLLIPAFETGIKRRRTFRYLRELERSQWIDTHSLELLQFLRLRELLLHADQHCAFYRDLWLASGVNVTDVNSLNDFTKFPLIDREMIRTNRPAMRSSKTTKFITKSTGGSSGTPLTFDLDLESNERRTAAWHRGYGWASAAPGTKQFYLWGTALQPRSRMASLKESLWNRLHRKTLCNSFTLTQATATSIAAQINRTRPEAIIAYVKPLYELARCLEEQNIRAYAPASIVVGAEKLLPFERETIERVFRAPVFETYGSREFMLIAAECERHNGLHLTAEHLLVELLDERDRPVAAGVEGDVVITDLFNFGMPFIRYRTGDRAVRSATPCSCGRSLPMLSRIVGRQLDVIRTPDGRLVPGEFFPHLMKDFQCVRRFQITQHSLSNVTVRIVAGEGFDHAGPKLTQLIRQQLGPLVTVVIQQVDDIPLSPAGKLRVVVNLIPTTRAA